MRGPIVRLFLAAALWPALPAQQPPIPPEVKTRLAALIDARQQSLSEAEQALAAQRQRAAQLAGQAANLKDLIAKMEACIQNQRRGME